MVEFDIPIYGGTVSLFTNREEFNKEYEKIPEDDRLQVAECMGVVHPINDGGLRFLMGVFDKDHLTLVHECTHLAIFICENTGWSINTITAEPFCYLLEELVKRGQEGLVD